MTPLGEARWAGSLSYRRDRLVGRRRSLYEQRKKPWLLLKS
jgi:hypothetical protein